MEIFAERLTKLRKERRLSQAEAARQMIAFIGSSQVLSSYERDKREPNLETVVELARYYGVSTDYLLGLSSEEQPQLKDICDRTYLSPLAVKNLLCMGEPSDLGGDPNCLWALGKILEGFSDDDCMGVLLSITEFLEFKSTSLNLINSFVSADMELSQMESFLKTLPIDIERFEKLTNGALEQQILNEIADGLRTLRGKYYSDT